MQRYFHLVFLFPCFFLLNAYSVVWFLTNANYQDHYFDVITNVVGLVAAVLADKFYWWVDPAGAIVLAIYTISNWSATVLENAGTYASHLSSFGVTKFSRLKLRSIVPFSGPNLPAFQTNVTKGKKKTVKLYPLENFVIC